MEELATLEGSPVVGAITTDTSAFDRESFADAQRGRVSLLHKWSAAVRCVVREALAGEKAREQQVSEHA